MQTFHAGSFVSDNALIEPFAKASTDSRETTYANDINRLLFSFVALLQFSHLPSYFEFVESEFARYDDFSM